MGWRSGQSYSQDLRDRVIGAVDGGMAVRQAAATFGVSIAYIYKALIRRRLTGDSRHEPAGDVVGFGSRGDLAIERGGLLLQVAERADQHGQAGPGCLRQIRGGILDMRDQPLDVEGALRRDQW